MAPDVSPIRAGVKALPHPPVYRMHRYFARRPANLFAHLLKHYSKKGDVVLDPFCGGGVTVVEGTQLGRRAVGIDLNPLAVFITKHEVDRLDIGLFTEASKRVVAAIREVEGNHFATACRQCSGQATVEWVEHASLLSCACGFSSTIDAWKKTGVGTWACPRCQASRRFSPDASTQFVPILVRYACSGCGPQSVPPSDDDVAAARQAEARRAELLQDKDVPTASIPDCNMARESALHRKGIHQFHQLFTARHLLLLSELRRLIRREPREIQPWLRIAFSSTLRYTNRMVTRNPAWRGDRPLEWAKPGFWLPPIHLEARVSTEFERRCAVVQRAKLVQQRQFTGAATLTDKPQEVIAGGAGAFVAKGSATYLPLPDASVDLVLTDPPYGSYVHYADLSNFWAVWLEEEDGMGHIIDAREEAVVARKKFPGAKTADDYQQLLTSAFRECYRVLKPDSYMVMTFHNREPRAWGALLIAAARAGFELPEGGVIFQDGIAAYKHTAQSRRAGSVVGDFILTFRRRSKKSDSLPARQLTERVLTDEIRRILKSRGPTEVNDLMRELYLELIPLMMREISRSLEQGGDAHEVLARYDAIGMLDSHRRSLLEENFTYAQGRWMASG